MKGIGTYGVYKPEYARGTGKYIKDARHQRYRTNAERARIIEKNRRYLDRNRHRLKVFELYEHPGNVRIMRWPALPEQARTLSLWLCYKPEARHHPQVRCNLDGIHTLTKYYPAEDHEQRTRLYDKLMLFAAHEIDQGRLWLARMYEQPTNEQVFSWSEQKGEIFPGHALESVEMSLELEDLKRELDQYENH